MHSLSRSQIQHSENKVKTVACFETGIEMEDDKNPTSNGKIVTVFSALSFK
jgi:hypothetical protein